MPSTETILVDLTALANQWQPLAIGWHVVTGALILAMIAGWRPSNRVAARLLTLPVLSVSAMAWTSGNPFNGATFGFLALLLAWFATGLSAEAVRVSSPPVTVAGGLLLTFGWTYPHFLAADRWTTYLYAAPLGLIPCPTLSALIGVTLILGRFESTLWPATLALLGIAYGVIGIVRLGVAMDGALLSGAGALGALCLFTAFQRRQPSRRIPRRAVAARGRVTKSEPAR
jgi:hypothetical protein